MTEELIEARRSKMTEYVPRLMDEEMGAARRLDDNEVTSHDSRV